LPLIYEKLSKLFSRLNLLFAGAGAFILFAITAFVFFEVMSRALLGTSRLWVIEVSEYSLFFLTFMGAPYLLEKNRHVVIDLVLNELAQRSKLNVSLFNGVLGALICVVLTYAGVEVVLDQFDTGVREATVMAPQKYWITAVFPIGMALMSFQFIDKIIRIISSGKIS
jgi:C4-dicarboxylate transporter, DctQ subunit